MRFFSTNHLAFLAAVLPVVYAGCYSGGTSGDQAYANDNIALICDDTTPNMGGNYAPWEVRHQCWDTPDGNHYDFYIYNYMASTEFMDPNGCITYLGDEINGCQYGGDSTYNFGTSYWRFIADPNSGGCDADRCCD